MEIKNGVSVDGSLAVSGSGVIGGWANVGVRLRCADAADVYSDGSWTINSGGVKGLYINRFVDDLGGPIETEILTITGNGNGMDLRANGDLGPSCGYALTTPEGNKAAFIAYDDGFVVADLTGNGVPFLRFHEDNDSVSLLKYTVLNEKAYFYKEAEFSNIVKYTKVTSPANLTASQNNWNPIGSGSVVPTVICFTCNASLSITGLIAGASGQRVTLCNVGANNITLSHESTSSTTNNRFKCPNSAAFTLRKNGAVDLWYDSTSSRWRVIAP